MDILRSRRGGGTLGYPGTQRCMVEITDKFSGVKEKSLSVEAVCTYPLFPIIFIFLRFFFFIAPSIVFIKGELV